MYKKILLIDICTWKGHHEIYFKKILLSLTKSGFFVYASCENNPALNQWLQELNLQNCHVLEAKLSLIDKLFFKILSIIDNICSNLSPKTTFRFSSIVHLLFTKNLLQQIGQEIPVFFAHGDSAIPSIPLWVARLLLPSKWVALSIQPSYQSAIAFGKLKSRQRFVAEKLFSLNSCKAVLYLHPVYTKFFKTRFQENKFFVLPEIVDVNVSEHSEIADKVQHLASGRKIISITGALLPKRNLQLFLKSVQQLNPDEYFILIVGHLPQECYSSEELKIIQELSFKLSENSYIRCDYYIPNEEKFNELLKISDIIYLQYQKHSSSSNLLSKCIKLRKPVIVGNGYVMQKVVNAYNWQAIVSEEPDKIVEAIIRLAHHFKIDEVKYQQFLIDYAEEKFNLAIEQAIKMINEN
jgi:phosphohistidine phosphatase SixA